MATTLKRCIHRQFQHFKLSYKKSYIASEELAKFAIKLLMELRSEISCSRSLILVVHEKCRHGINKLIAFFVSRVRELNKRTKEPNCTESQETVLALLVSISAITGPRPTSCLLLQSKYVVNTLNCKYDQRLPCYEVTYKVQQISVQIMRFLKGKRREQFACINFFTAERTYLLLSYKTPPVDAIFVVFVAAGQCKSSLTF